MLASQSEVFKMKDFFWSKQIRIISENGSFTRCIRRWLGPNDKVDFHNFTNQTAVSNRSFLTENHIDHNPPVAELTPRLENT